VFLSDDQNFGMCTKEYRTGRACTSTAVALSAVVICSSSSLLCYGCAIISLYREWVHSAAVMIEGAAQGAGWLVHSSVCQTQQKC
jgi:hypothetical protein